MDAQNLLRKQIHVGQRGLEIAIVVDMNRIKRGWMLDFTGVKIMFIRLFSATSAIHLLPYNDRLRLRRA